MRLKPTERGRSIPPCALDLELRPTPPLQDGFRFESGIHRSRRIGCVRT
jgi:hypothetical protein